MSNGSSHPQPYIPALAALYKPLGEWSYPLMRFIAGIILAPHGAQKLFG